ncbi:MAG: DUF4215 domain-containing protein [Polyangiaceae bacterium]
MPSCRFPFGFAAARLLGTLLLTVGAVVACGGSPEVVNDNDNGPGSGAGSGNGHAGNGSAGSSLDLPDAGPIGDGGSQDLPEAGPGCGDGIVNQKSEECDDGNTLPGDGCSGACTKEDYSECPPKGGECMSTIQCGDGVIEASEACDDGNADDGDGCSSDCLFKEPNY